MKTLRFLALLALCLPAFAQTINLQTDVRGLLPPANGGLGIQPTAADQIPISLSPSVIAFEQMFNCATDGLHGLTYSTSSHTFTCVTMANGAPAFSAITNGTSTATLVMGSGGSLTPTGTGQIMANYINGVAICAGAASATGYALITSSTTAACWSPFSGGSVTTLTAPSASWPSWLVPTVTNPSSTPNLTVVATAIPNGALASPSTTVNGSTCTLGASCTIPAAAFSAITGGTNTSAAMTVGAGASLTYSGAGTINASSLGGLAANLYPTLAGVNTFTGGANYFNGILSPNSTIQQGVTSGANQFEATGGNTFLGLVEAWPTGSATSSLVYAPGPLGSCGSYWTGSAAAYDCYTWAYNIAAGANGNSTYTLTGSGSTGTHAINFGNPFTAPSVNNVLQADQFAGADVGAKINAAFASQAGTSGSPTWASTIKLAPNGNYSFATTIVIPNSTTAPYIQAPNLDCQGAILQYTGSGEAVSVLGETPGATSGSIKNCIFNNQSATSTSGTHQHSRISFTYENDGWVNFSNGSEAGLLIDNDGSGSTYNERTNIINPYFANDHYGVEFFGSNGGTNSFARTVIRGGMCTFNTGQDCMYLVGNVNPNSAWMYDSYIDMRGNGGGGTSIALQLNAGGTLVDSVLNMGFENVGTCININGVGTYIQGSAGVFDCAGAGNTFTNGATASSLNFFNLTEASSAVTLTPTGGTASCVYTCTAGSGTLAYTATSIEPANTMLVKVQPNVSPGNINCTVSPADSTTAAMQMWGGAYGTYLGITFAVATTNSTAYHFTYHCF